MTGEKDTQPDWLQEFKKANSGYSHPLSPAPLPEAGPGKNPSERRHHPRFGVDGAPALLRPRGIVHLFFKRDNIGRATLDLSEGGARLLALRRLQPGSPVHVKILFGKFQDEIDSDGEIRWCRQKSPAGDDFLLGLMFKDRDPERDRKIALMRGYFTSPQFLAALEKRQKEISSALLMKK
jgi:hypothetical protein